MITVSPDFDFERHFSEVSAINLGDDVDIVRVNPPLVKGHVWSIKTINNTKTLEVKLSSFGDAGSLYFIKDKSQDVWRHVSDKTCTLSLSKKLIPLCGEPN
jgi:hypothetical protein